MEKKMSTVPEMPKNLSRFMGNLCLTYLSGACQIAYPCKYSHITLPERSLKANVANASDIEVIECYELSLQYMKLFRLYFRVFCEIFGLRKMQSKLVKMIGDFEVKGRPTECYKYIAKALESCGMDSVDVVKTIISNNKVRFFLNLMITDH